MARKIRQKKQLTEEEQKALDHEKELQEQGIQDDFQARGFELVDWMQHNRGVVLGLIAIVVLGGAVAGVLNATSATANAEASALFFEGHDAYSAPLGDAPAIVTGASADTESYKDEKERATKAREKFQATVAAQPGTGVATLAQLYIGHTSMTLGEYDQAIEGYNAFLNGSERDDPLRALALDGLASAYDAKGEPDKAIEQLETLVGLPGKAGEALALLKIAKLYERTGKQDEAKAAAERLSSDFADSPLKSQADELLGRLKGG